MAEKAEGLLASSGWLPEPLRTPGRQLPFLATSPDVEVADVQQDASAEPVGEETAVDGGEPAMGDADDLADDEEVAEVDAPFAYAAE